MELQTGQFNKIDAGWTEENFKKEWSHIERAGVNALLTNLIHEQFEVQSDANRFFGFAWTSSGRFAELGVNESGFTIDGNSLEAFIISKNNMLVAHCLDEEENDIFFEVA